MRSSGIDPQDQASWLACAPLHRLMKHSSIAEVMCRPREESPGSSKLDPAVMDSRLTLAGWDRRSLPSHQSGTEIVNKRPTVSHPDMVRETYKVPVRAALLQSTVPRLAPLQLVAIKGDVVELEAPRPAASASSRVSV